MSRLEPTPEETFRKLNEPDTTRNLPVHYDIPGIEQPLMDIIFAVCENNAESKKEYCLLYNALKYMFRYGNKNGHEDLEKEKDYITRIEEIRYTNERR